MNISGNEEGSNLLVNGIIFIGALAVVLVLFFIIQKLYKNK